MSTYPQILLVDLSLIRRAALSARDQQLTGVMPLVISPLTKREPVLVLRKRTLV